LLVRKSDIARLDGFSGWLEISRLLATRNSSRRGWANVAPPASPGVYFFAATPVTLTKGTSGIHYIGKADQLRKRLGLYLYTINRWLEGTEWVAPERSPQFRIARRYIEDGVAFEVGWLVTRSEEDAERREAQLLHSFVDEHGGLPPLNWRPGSSRWRRKR
jgi:hypothetical protein